MSAQEAPKPTAPPPAPPPLDAGGFTWVATRYPRPEPNVLFAPVPATVAFVVGLAIGVAYAVMVLGPAAATGAGAWWQLPWGFEGGHVGMRSMLAGYTWLLREPPQHQLLALRRADWPAGSNAYLFDVIPLVALPAKLAFAVTGRIANPYAVWMVGCFALNAAALVTLVRTLGQRTLLAAVLAGGLGAMAPALHAGFGNPALAGQFPIVLALAVAFAAPARDGTGFFSLLSLCLLAIFIHPAIYAATATVAVAALLQGMVAGRVSFGTVVLAVPLLLAAGAAPLWWFGVLGWGGLHAPLLDGRVADLAKLAPFWTQTSAIFGFLRPSSESVATIAAHEGGFGYLGLGVMVLLLFAALRQIRRWPRQLWRHGMLVVLVLALTATAMGMPARAEPLLAPWLARIPYSSTTVMAWIGGGARAFWPVFWMLAGVGIAGALAGLPQRAMLLIATLALCLQFTDLLLWREAIRTVIATPPASAFGNLQEAGTVQQQIARLGRVTLLPSGMCRDEAAGESLALVAAVEVQLMAARANADMPALPLRACNTTAPAQLDIDGVLVALTDPDGVDRTADARAPLDCRAVLPGWLCLRGGS